MRIFTLIFCLLFASNIQVNAQAGPNCFEDVAAAIRAGNSREVSRFFTSSLELTIVNKENICSKVQAEMIIRDFFSQNSPVSFVLIHKGSSSKGAAYAIGRLETSNGSYRTYIFMKEIGGRNIIQELRIEKD